MLTSTKSIPGSSPWVGLTGSEMHSAPGREVQADAVLERRVRLVMEVDRDLELGEQLGQAVVGRAVSEVHGVEAVLDRDEKALAVGGRASDEEASRRALWLAHGG